MWNYYYYYSTVKKHTGLLQYSQRCLKNYNCVNCTIVCPIIYLLQTQKNEQLDTNVILNSGRKENVLTEGLHINMSVHTFNECILFSSCCYTCKTMCIVIFIPRLHALPLLALYCDSDFFSQYMLMFFCVHLQYIFLRSHYNCWWHW